MNPLELHIRSEGDAFRTSIIAVRPAPDDRSPRNAAFPPGLAVGTPMLSRFEFCVGRVLGDDDPEAVVTTSPLGMSTSLEVIADLAEPLKHRDTRRVYVVSGGTLSSTIMCDADTGEHIPFDQVRIVIAVDSVTRAWVS